MNTSFNDTNVVVVMFCFCKRGYIISKLLDIYKYVMKSNSSLYIQMMKLVLVFTFPNFLLAIPTQKKILVEMNDEVNGIFKLFI